MVGREGWKKERQRKSGGEILKFLGFEFIASR